MKGVLKVQKKKDMYSSLLLPRQNILVPLSKEFY